MSLLERSSLSRLVKPDRPDTSEMLLLERFSTVRLVKPDSGDISEMLLRVSSSVSRLVKPDSGKRSEIELLLRKLLTVSGPKFRLVRRVANSIPVKSLMFASGASSLVKVAISALVIGVPRTLPRLSSITAAQIPIRNNNLHRLATAGRGRYLFAKAIAKDQKIGESNYAVAVQIISGFIRPIAPT